MSTRLVDPRAEHACSMCPAVVYAPWGTLATKGWRSHYAGADLAPIVLCADCRKVIDARREATVTLAAELDRP